MTGDSRHNRGARRRRSLRAVAVAAALVVEPLGAALAQVPADGFWIVTGRAVPGTRCADWDVRLAVEQGRLTGTVGVGQGNVILQNLALRPDGSFSGNTLAGHINGRVVRAYQVRGQFSGNTVNLTLSNEICPDRSGAGFRRVTGY